jgi:hypothetical protein
MLRTLPPASDKDVESYRGWMQEHSPIAKAETRFLDHNRDLVSLSANRLAASRHDNNMLYFIIGIMSAALLLPLLAF